MKLRIFIPLVLFPFLSSVAISGTIAKETASGVYDLLAGDTVQKPVSVAELTANPCWANQNFAGVVLRTSWAKVSSVQDQFDWTYLDAGVALAHSSGKKVCISVHAGVDSPQWIFDLGAKYLVIPNFGTMPIPWDPLFQQHWALFVKTLGAKYDGDAAVTYVTMGGPGRLEEEYVCTTQSSIRDFDDQGGIPYWTQAAEKIVDMYATAFPNTPFLYAYGAPIPGPHSSAPFSDVTNYGAGGYPGRFGIKSDALKPHMSLSFWPTVKISELSSATTVGYQMTAPFDGRKLFHGTIGEALGIGIKTGAHFIEVYTVDCNNPKYQAALSAANTQLLSTYP